MKLWQKQWKLDSLVEQFETGDDLVLDQHLVGADCLGSMAHAAGLRKIGLITPAEFDRMHVGLSQILAAWKKGSFTLGMGDEDVHTKIENTLGAVGKKIHTGRSRNDQVVTAIRIYTKQELLEIWTQTLLLADAFGAYAKHFEAVPMPGYTHMQKAMPSSVGMWASAYAEGLVDAVGVIEASYRLNDQSPLGSAAGYGVPIPINREYTAKLLGFARVQRNSLACQNMRGVIEAAVVASCIAVLQLVSKFAADILLFTTKEFDLFKVSDELTTGSSIMPQKRNVDIAELTRSKVSVVAGNYAALVGITAGLPGGYNRDLQDTKKPLMESLWTTKSTIQAALKLLSGLSPQTDRLRGAMTPELFAAHQAFRLVSHGMAFRDAYHSVGMSANYQSALEINEFDAVVREYSHTGSTGNLGLAALAKEISSRRQTYEKIQKAFDSRIGVLMKGKSL